MRSNFFYTTAFSVWLEKCADHPVLTVIWLEFSPAEQVLIKINGKSYKRAQPGEKKERERERRTLMCTDVCTGQHQSLP